MVGKVAHDVPLGCGQIHLVQCTGYGMVGTGVQNPQAWAVMLLQDDHLLE